MNEAMMRIFNKNKASEPKVECENLYTMLNEFEEIHCEKDFLFRGRSLSIKFAEPNQRMRKVVRRSNYRMTGKFPSLKNGRMMHWESHNELAAFRILEICPNVKSYSEQPALIKYKDHTGIINLHYPDILVKLSGENSLFIEIKPNFALDDLDLEKRATLLKPLLKHEGYDYLMVVSQQLESFSYLENARHLLFFGKYQTSENIHELTRRAFLSTDTIELSKLTNYLQHELAENYIYKMIITGFLVCDLSVPLSAESLLSLGNSEIA
ncbi:TnsA endonuclease N-terminal domain-containing protein [Methylotenera mobilis]|uniref:TnsA endonuclease N-terminal domain-containing protein n=1 Tax=Methylotenera mobilis TaxID=359408 RepID=UPI00036FF72B|nr:TnsA endonuclease N-terminal domain-containing protein [Methylotenera mobilis]